MPPKANVLGQAQSLIQSRLRELDEERARLERALRDLGGSVASRARAGGARRGPGRPPGSGTKTRRRRRKGGTRAEQALKVIKASPGITVSEIAKQLKIAPNYVYRVMAELQKDKLVSKKGKGFHAR
jgi:transposase-like protein